MPTSINWTFEDGNPIQFDNQGTLTSDHTYVIVTFTLENKSEEKKQIYLNTMRLLINKDGKPVDELASGLEPFYRDTQSVDSHTKSYFQVTLNTDRKKTYSLGYLIPDKYNNCELKWRINESGISPTSIGWENIVDVLLKEES